MYIYRTKKYFVKLYKRYYKFNLLLMHLSFLSSSILWENPLSYKSYCFVSPDFMSRPFCLHVAMMPLVDFKMNVIKWKLHFVSCNFGLKSNSRFAVVRFCNHAFDFRPNCTPVLVSAITIINNLVTQPVIKMVQIRINKYRVCLNNYLQNNKIRYVSLRCG